MDEYSTLHPHIYERMQEKETDELLRIWNENDRSAWTDEAFQVVGQILKDRLGEAPPQPPYYGPGMPRNANESVEQVDEDDEYNETDLRFRRVGIYAKVLSYLMLAAAMVVIMVILFGGLRQEWPLTQTMPGAASVVLLVGGTGGFFYVLLQFIAQGVIILLEIRDNTSE